MERLMLDQCDYFIRKYNLCLKELGTLYRCVRDFVNECSAAQVEGNYEGFATTHCVIIPFTTKKKVESVICILPLLDRVNYELFEIFLPIYKHYVLIRLPAREKKLITRRLLVLFTHIDGLYQLFVRCYWCLPIARSLELTVELAELMNKYHRTVNYLTFNRLSTVRTQYLEFLEHNYIDVDSKYSFQEQYKNIYLPLIEEKKVNLVFEKDREAHRLTFTPRSPPPPTPPS